MEAVLVLIVLLGVVGYLVIPTVVTAVETERRRRQLAREALLADLRLRRVAQAGFLSMVAETRRLRDEGSRGE
jgi:type II secretory pathway pseudopilin PulG